MLALFLGLVWLLWAVITLWRQRPKPISTGEGTSADKLVVFASQTGTARALAADYAKQRGLPAPAPLGQIPAQTLLQVSELHCFVSTYGDGEAPDNGKRFTRTLRKLEPDLSRLRFNVTALGDSRYPQFCAFGQALYQTLQARGATPLGPIACIDANQPDKTISRRRRQYTDATLICRERLNPQSLSPGLYALSLRLKTGHWQAGDWLDVLVPDPANPSDYLVPRTYSVASAGNADALRLIVRHVIKPDGQKGQASDYLTHGLVEGGRIKVRLRNNPAVSISDNRVPLLLVGAGSGLAGLLGFIEERAGHAEAGPVWLIYGERDPQHDRPFERQMERWQQDRVITRLDRVFSRAAPDTMPASSTYCQHVLQQNCEAVSSFLEDHGHIVVCGSLEGMGTGVDAALREILGESALEKMVQENRYHRDLY